VRQGSAKRWIIKGWAWEGQDCVATSQYGEALFYRNWGCGGVRDLRVKFLELGYDSGVAYHAVDRGVTEFSARCCVHCTEYQDIASWWTSGNFMVRNQQWMWTSKHHLKSIAYSRWAAASAPAVDSTASPGRMHCLLLDRLLQYHWVEANCADRHNFICEHDDA